MFTQVEKGFKEIKGRGLEIDAQEEWSKKGDIFHLFVSCIIFI